MCENPSKIDLKQLISYSDDLIRVLKEIRDPNKFTHCVDQSKSLHSYILSDLNSNYFAISDCQKKIDDCKHKVEVALTEEVSDEIIDLLQNELDDKLKKEHLLREELRVIVEQISELDHQRLSIEEKREWLTKLEEEQETDQRKLSFYASVTKIIPDLETPSKISGCIVERGKNALKKFHFDPLQEDAFDICNKTWKMMNF